MPLTRQAMHNSGEHIHIALWPRVHEMLQVASRAYAFEGRCYVIAVGQMMYGEDFPQELELPEHISNHPGGVIINGRFAFGGIGMGLVNSMDIIDDDSNGNNDASLDLNYGAGGLFMEYIFNSESPVFFSIPVNLMGGEITLEDPTSDTEVESSGVFIIEPGINVDFRFTSNFVTGINLSYRQVIGSSLDNLSDQDISGVNIGLIFKFGSF